MKNFVISLHSLIAGLIFLLLYSSSYSQNIYSERKFQFLSFEKIPTWVGVITNWNKESPDLHLYDGAKYKGHAQYISVGLKTGITFKQFKQQVKNPESRKYMPFFLFDLREVNVTIDGLRYEWAVRIEDYRYQDNQQEMEETCLRLLDIISKYIEKSSGNFSKGIIILATNKKATPNISIAPALNKERYPNMTLSQLREKAGGKKAEVLNPGTAVGYLRYIKDEEKEFYPSPKDILIYESLPERVLPVSGIITLKPQTPLSHINLLAKNRGTINLYAAELKYIPGADKLINKLVKIECSENKIVISEIDEKKAEKFWEARIKKVDIPKANSTVTEIIDLNKVDNYQTTQYIGAKASNYAFIRQGLAGYVSKGYAVPFAYYFKTIKSCGADILINKLLKQKPKGDELNNQLKKIREKILDAEADKSLIEKIKKLQANKFGKSRIRLRSSTNCEDLPEFNGAGLYISKGYNFDDGYTKLTKKILQIYASLWSSRAFEEREFYFIDHSKAGMAILINRAFSNEYANGVAITTVKEGKISVYINTQYGENSVTNPENGQIPESILFKTSLSDDYEIKSKSNINDIFIQDDMKNKLIELKNTVLKIHQMMLNIPKNEEAIQSGVDVEFKLMKENGEYKLYIKQARLLNVVLPN